MGEEVHYTVCWIHLLMGRYDVMTIERTYGMTPRGEPMPQTIEEWHHLTDLGEVVMRRQLKEIGELKSKVASLSQKVASQKARLDKCNC